MVVTAEKPGRLLLPAAKLTELAAAMHGMSLPDGHLHRWRYSPPEPGTTKDRFMHARENPTAHWLAYRLIREQLKTSEHAGGAKARGAAGDSPLQFMDPKFDSVVVGDPHFGNIDIFPLTGPGPLEKKAQRSTRDQISLHLAYNDIDDAGMGALFGDVLRNAATSAIAGFPVRDQITAYVKGLGIAGLEFPKWVEKLLLTPLEDFREAESELAAKLYRDGTFTKSGGSLSRELPRSIIDSIYKQFPDTVWNKGAPSPEMVMFVKAAGGSGGVPRFWVLRDLNGLAHLRTVTELKWLTHRPGVIADMVTQPSAAERFYIAGGLAWHHRQSPDIKLVTVDFGDAILGGLTGKVSCFARPRYPKMIKKELERRLEAGKSIHEFVKLSALLLGENHDMSTGTADDDFLALIERNPEAFQRASADMVATINEIFSAAYQAKYGAQ